MAALPAPAQLRRIADVADKYHVPMVKITGGQRIDLLGIRRKICRKVWHDLGMPSGYAYTKSVSHLQDLRRHRLLPLRGGRQHRLGIKIEKRFQGIEVPHKMKLATAGCPRNCSEATIKDVGAVAVEGGRWEIYIGGGGRIAVRKGDILCIVTRHEEVLEVHGPLHAVLPRECASTSNELTILWSASESTS